MCTDLRFIIVSLCEKTIKEYIRESIEVIPIALAPVKSPGARAVTLKFTFLLWARIWILTFLL